MIALVDETSWQLLRERLDAAVTADPALAPARALVKAPVALLAALGQDIEAALGDDRLALERVRVLLSTSAVHAPPLSSMRALLAGPGTGPRPAGAMAPRDQLRDGIGKGVVHTGGLVLAGLAASRAGAEVGLSDAFVDHVLALAIAVTPAEALSRAVASGLTDSQLRAVLAALLPTESGDRRLSMVVVSFVADPLERARWRALDSLFGLLRETQPSTVWEGATSEGIVAVEPRQACPGATIEIRVRLEPHATTALPPHTAGLLADLAQGDAQVAFASVAGPTIGAPAKAVDQSEGVVRVVVPGGARAGWVGVTSARLVTESNDSRAKLRAFWRAQNAEHPALRQTPVPTDAIALLPAIPAPRRHVAARFDGGIPVIELLAIEPPIVDSGLTASLRWRVLGAESITIHPALGKVADSGVAQLDLLPGQGTLTARLTAVNPCGETSATAGARVRVRLADLQVRLSGSDQPPHEGAPATVTARLTAVPKGVSARLSTGLGEQAMSLDGDVVSAELPAAQVTTHLAGRVRVFVDRETPDDERGFGPLRVNAPVRRRVVLIRPAVLSPTFGRVSASEAADALTRAGRELGVEFDAVAAPWIEEAGFVVDGVPGGSNTPATRRLIERLNLLSATTSGLEDAVWVALVPGADQRVAVVRAADAAAGLAVSSTSMLAGVLRDAPAPVESSTERLCLFGTIDPAGAVRVKDVRRRRQAVGGGAPIETGLSVFGVDAEGRDLSAVPMRLQSDVLPAPFVAMLPMAHEIVRVEVRLVYASSLIDIARFHPDPAGAHRWLARSVSQVVGEPALSNVRVSDGTLQWRYAHGRGVRPHLTIELRRGGGWWPIQRAGACASSVGLGLDRLAPATEDDAVRLVASDGWHTVMSRALRPGPVRPRAVMARYAGRRRFWVDLGDEDGAPSWRIGAVHTKGPVVIVPEGYEGPVELLVDTARGPVNDERIIDAKGRVDGHTVQ